MLDGPQFAGAEGCAGDDDAHGRVRVHAGGDQLFLNHAAVVFADRYVEPFAVIGQTQSARKHKVAVDHGHGHTAAIFARGMQAVGQHGVTQDVAAVTQAHGDARHERGE